MQLLKPSWVSADGGHALMSIDIHPGKLNCELFDNQE